MSADNGWVIRRNSKGKYVLQMYFASDDEFPDVNEDEDKGYDTLEEAVRAYAEQEDSTYPSEYGLRVLIAE